MRNKSTYKPPVEQMTEFDEAYGSFYGFFKPLKSAIENKVHLDEEFVVIIKNHLNLIVNKLESKYPELINPHLRESIEEYKTHYKSFKPTN